MSKTLIGQFAEGPDLALLADSVRAFVADKTDHRRTRALRQSELGYDPGLLRSMAELGWTGILLPPSSGGLGLGFGAMACAIKELGRGLMAEPIAASVVLAGQVLALADNEDIAGRLLPQLVAGERMPALAWQEKADGGDALVPDAARTTAEPAQGGARISGRKRWVAGGSDGFIVSAHGPDGLALYWLEADAPGLALKSQRQADGTPLRDLVLDGAFATMVASPAIAGDVIGRTVDAAAAMACAEMCGIAEFAMEVTLDYMRTRVQYGQAIGSFQALQHKAVDLYVQHELALSATLDAVNALDARVGAAERAREVSRAKARCSEAAVRITREAIQLHGAIGFTEQHDIGLYLKRALVLAAFCGNAEAHRRRHVDLTLDGR